MLKLQIVFHNGETVKFPAGGPIEADLVQIILNKVSSGPLTIKTRSRLEKDIQKAFYDFKAQIVQVPVRLEEK